MTIRTTIHTYAFQTSDPKELDAYKELHARLSKDKGRHYFNVINTDKGSMCGYPLKSHQSQSIELETSCLFNNQWNTAPGYGSDKGYRVFDWYEGYNLRQWQEGFL